MAGRKKTTKDTRFFVEKCPAAQWPWFHLVAALNEQFAEPAKLE